MPVARLREWRRGREEEEEWAVKSRRGTVLDVFKKRSIKTTEVGLDDTMELTEM